MHRQGGVALDDAGRDAADRLNCQRKRGHVQQQQARGVRQRRVFIQRVALNRRALRHAFVGVDALARHDAGQLAHLLLHGGDARRTADQQHLAQLAGGNACVAEGAADRTFRPRNQIRRQFIELRAGQRLLQMHRLTADCADERQADGGHLGDGQLLFRLLCGFLHAHHGRQIAVKVSMMFPLESITDEIHDALVEVIAAEVVVAARCQHFDNALANLDDGYVKRAAAKVVDHDFLRCAVVQAVGKGGAGRLVDDAADVQACNAPRVLRRLTLDVPEIRRDGNHRVGDGFAEITFRVLLQLAENHGADFLRRIAFPGDGLAPVRAHMALDGRNRAVGVDRRLTLRRAADEPFAAVGERHDGRRCALTLIVRNDGCAAALNHGDAAVGGTQVDTDDFAHKVTLSQGN